MLDRKCDPNIEYVDPGQNVADVIRTALDLSEKQDFIVLMGEEELTIEASLEENGVEDGARLMVNVNKNVWYCAVTYPQHVRAVTYSLAEAQGSLGVGSRGTQQMIVTMIDGKAQDPHTMFSTVPKSWRGGSMWWNGWPEIHTMQRVAEDCEPPPQGVT